MSSHRQGYTPLTSGLPSHPHLTASSSKMDIYFWWAPSSPYLKEWSTNVEGDSRTPCYCHVSLQWLHLRWEEIHFLSQELLLWLPVFFWELMVFYCESLCAGHNLCSLRQKPSKQTNKTPTRMNTSIHSALALFSNPPKLKRQRLQTHWVIFGLVLLSLACNIKE